MSKLQEIIDLFQAADSDMRLELLLDYARRLPPLEDRFHEARDAGLGAVPECQTPVFLWIETDDGRLHLHTEVAEEAPTVKGLLSILVESLDGQPVEAVNEVPEDLLHHLGLDRLIRMNRAIGFAAMVGRVKRQALQADANQPASHTH